MITFIAVLLIFAGGWLAGILTAYVLGAYWVRQANDQYRNS